MHPHRPSRKRLSITFAILIACFLAADIAVMSALDASRGEHIESFVMAVVLGVCIGQINLISIWAALAPGRIVVRLPWAMLLAVIMWTAVCIGLKLKAASIDDLYQAGVILLSAQLAAQTPLWIGAQFWKWRLMSARQVAAGVEASERQFRIMHVMIGTALLAISLSIFRYVISGEPVDWSLVTFEADILVILAAAMAANLLIVVPCVWIAFLPFPRLGNVILHWVVLVLVVSLVEYLSLAALLGGGPDTIEGLMVTATINLCQCAVVVVTLLKLRQFGFQLLRIRPASQ